MSSLTPKQKILFTINSLTTFNIHEVEERKKLTLKQLCEKYGDLIIKKFMRERKVMQIHLIDLEEYQERIIKIIRDNRENKD